MPDIENLLRAELKQTAQQVQPELLRPLRAPAPRRVWRPRLLPIAAAATVIAIIAVVALVTGLPASRQTPATRPVPAAAPPRYYVTILDVPHGQGMQVQAVVRATDGGRVTGTVAVKRMKSRLGSSAAMSSARSIAVSESFLALRLASEP